MITLLVVDDHPVVRDGLAALIETVENMTIVAQADTAERAVRAAQAWRPDVVLMDLNLPGASGIGATRQITRTLPGTAVLVLTMSEDDESIVAAVHAVARGYLLKGARQEEILQAIVTVASGGALFSPHAARQVMAHFARTTDEHVLPPFPDLTPRERQVLALLATGLRNRGWHSGSGSARRQSPTTFRPFSSSWASKTAPRPSSWPEKPAWWPKPGGRDG